MRNKILNIIFFLTWIATSTSYAQQDPQFTHYMYNMSVVNPAYATANSGTINTGGFYRTQWVGAVGAPKTGSLFVHSPVGKNMEMGISFINDAIGDVINQNNVYADFAYVIPLSDKTKLSFGVKGGATFFDANFDGFQLSDTRPDFAFQTNIHKVYPNVGTGTYFFGKNYYLGLSTPNLLTTKYLQTNNGIKTTGVDAVHYFFTGGYIFNLNDNLKFKPAFMAKAVSGAPIAMDVSANFLIKNLVEVGAAYRLGDSIDGLINFYVTPNMRVGYSYDYTLTNLGKYNSGTHEFFVLYDLTRNRSNSNGYDKSPRFF